MSFQNDFEQEYLSLSQSGTAMPATLQVVDSTGMTLRLELVQLNNLSCSFSELALFVPALQNAPFSVLEKWASDLSQRITYLLEKLGPLEFDPANGQVLVRSSPPTPRPTGTQYYEILLTTSGNGTFSLKRFQFQSGQPGRIDAEVQVTREVLFRLVEDLLATIPAPGQPNP